MTIQSIATPLASLKARQSTIDRSAISESFRVAARAAAASGNRDKAQDILNAWGMLSGDDMALMGAHVRNLYREEGRKA